MQFPTRVSSILHWRTLQRLLSLFPASGTIECPSPSFEVSGIPVPDFPETPQAASSGGVAPVSASKSDSPYSTPESTFDYMDAHCHIDCLLHAAQYPGNLTEFLANQKINTTNFQGCIANFCDVGTLTNQENWQNLVKVKLVLPTTGFHPKHARNFTQDTDRVIRHLLGHPKTCALGEVGLDYSWGRSRYKTVVHWVLRRLLKMAVENQTPVVLHCRSADDNSHNAEDDCFQIVSETLPSSWKIHSHCYTNCWKRATKRCTQFPNLCIGLTPIIMLETTGPREVAKRIPLGRLLFETDAPYFKPRGSPHSLKFSNPTNAKLVDKLNFIS